MAEDPKTPPGFPGGHVPIVGEVVGDGEVRFRRRSPDNPNGPPDWLKIIPDDAPVVSRHDTLSMGEAWRRLEERDAAERKAPPG